MPKADAKNQMLNAVCRKEKPAKNQMLKKCKTWSIKYINTQKVMKYKKTKEKSESVTVPKQFKTPEFQNGMSVSTLIQFIHEVAPRNLWLLKVPVAVLLFMSLTVKVLTLTTTCECTFSLYYRILIQGGKTHPLIFIVGTNNFIEYLQSYQILIFIY